MSCVYWNKNFARKLLLYLFLMLRYWKYISERLNGKSMSLRGRCQCSAHFIMEHQFFLLLLMSFYTSWNHPRRSALSDNARSLEFTRSVRQISHIIFAFRLISWKSWHKPKASIDGNGASGKDKSGNWCGDVGIRRKWWWAKISISPHCH